MTRPRLLLLVPATEYHQKGGAEHVVKTYTSMAMSWGFEVLIATAKPKAEIRTKAPDNHLLIEDWPTYYSDGSAPHGTTQTLRKLIQEVQPHIIHALSIGTLRLLETTWPSKRSFAVVFSYFETPYQWPTSPIELSQTHTTDLEYLKDPWAWYSRPARDIVTNSCIDAYVPFSDLYCEWGYSVLGVPKRVPCITALPVVTRRQPPKESNSRITVMAPSKYAVIAARAVPRKGILGLLLSIRHYSRANTPLHILMTDPRPNDSFHARYRRQISSLIDNFPHMTVLPADLQQEELDFLYKGACFVLYPSFHEGYGLVPIEAARVGCPTIGFDIPGTKHTLVSGRNGWRVNCYDWKSLIGLADRIWEDQLPPHMHIGGNVMTRWVSDQREQAELSWQRVHKLLITLSGG